MALLGIKFGSIIEEAKKVAGDVGDAIKEVKDAAANINQHAAAVAEAPQNLQRLNQWVPLVAVAVFALVFVLLMRGGKKLW